MSAGAVVKWAGALFVVALLALVLIALTIDMIASRT